MAELKCPHCGQAFTVDDTELDSIIRQIRDSEFEKDLRMRTGELENHLKEKHELELRASENKIRLEALKENEDEIEALKEELKKAKDENYTYKTRLESFEDKKRLAVMEAIKKSDEMAREESSKHAKEILGLAIQRCAADHTADTTVSVVS